MKKIILNDIRITIILSFAWSILIPFNQSTKGLIDPTMLSAYLILGTLLMEFMPKLNKITNYKTSFVTLLYYDIFFMISTLITFALASESMFAYIFIFLLEPYWLLMKNSHVKFNTMVIERYNERLYEKINVNMTVYTARVSLISFVIAGALNLLLDKYYIYFTFIFILFISSIYSMYSYFKYIKPLYVCK